LQKQLGMIVEIDTEFIVSHNLSPNEFCYLHALFAKDYLAGESVAVLNGKVNVDPHKLEKEGWVKLCGVTIQEVELRQKAIDLFLVDTDKLWMEFCNTFPYKTVDGRVLRTLDPMKSSNEAAKKLYLKATKNGKPLIHKIIMQGLDNELAARRANNSLRYINNLETWLRNKMWEKYLTEDSTSKDTNHRVQGV
jgi:hypothetical protein